MVQGATTTESYSYDGVGNRLSLLGMSPYNYNPSNDLTSAPSGSHPLAIRRAGMLMSHCRKFAPGTTSYYEQDGLAAITGPV